MMRDGGCQFQEVLPIAADEHEFRRCRMGEHRCIGAVRGKNLPQPSDVVSETLEREAKLIGNVVIEEKMHRSGGGHLPGHQHVNFAAVDFVVG